MSKSPIIVRTTHGKSKLVNPNKVQAVFTNSASKTASVSYANGRRYSITYNKTYPTPEALGDAFESACPHDWLCFADGPTRYSQGVHKAYVNPRHIIRVASESLGAPYIEEERTLITFNDGFVIGSTKSVMSVAMTIKAIVPDHDFEIDDGDT